MEIVIEIPNFVWIENIKDFKSAVKEYDKGSGFDHAIREALLLGTPLPKHHGRLIDADDLLNTNIDTFSQQTELKIKFAPTIIKAEKEGSDVTDCKYKTESEE